MKVMRSALLVLFAELGFKTADKWTVERLKSKVAQLGAVVDEDNQPTTDASKKLLSALLKLDDADALEITDDVRAEEAEEAAPAKPAKKKVAPVAEEAEAEEAAPAKPAKKKVAPAAPAAEEEGEAEEAEAEEAAPAKPAKKKVAPAAPAAEEEVTVPVKPKGKRPEKAGGNGGPGVIGTIVEVVQKATASKPATKEAILNVLCERFPDRPRDSMARTINVQLPGRLRSDKGLNVVKAEKGGYYVDSSGK